MSDILTNIQALANDFDPAKAMEAFGSFTKQQLADLQKTLAVQMESMQKSEGDPDKERKLQNLAQLRELVKDTMQATLTNLLADTVRKALESGTMTPELLKSAGAAPLSVEAPRPDYPTVSAFDAGRAIIDTPLPIIGQEVPAQKQEANPENLSFEEYKQEVDPNNTMGDFLLGVRYWLVYQPYRIFTNMFGGLGKYFTTGAKAPPAKPAEPTVTYTSTVETPAAVTEEKKLTPTKETATPETRWEDEPVDLSSGVDPFANPPRTPRDRLPATPKIPEEENIPDRITFNQIKNGVNVSKYSVRVFDGNKIEVNKQRWALIHDNGHKLQFKNMQWENGKLVITGEPVEEWKRAFTSDEANTMILNKTEALELLDYLATSRNPKPLKTNDGKPMDVTLTPLR